MHGACLRRIGAAGVEPGDGGEIAVFDHVKHQTNAGHVGNQVAAAVTEEGKRDTCDGHETGRHAYIFKYVEQKHGHNADNGHLTEAVHGVAAQVEHAKDDEQINENHQKTADKAESNDQAAAELELLKALRAIK